MTRKELTNVRGQVISQFCNIETWVCFIISLHYLKQINTDFVINVLGHEQCTFGFKRNILTHIIADNKINQQLLQKLGTVSRIRNIFAHASEVFIEDPTPDGDIFFRNPKSQDDDKKLLDPRLELEDFQSSYAELIAWLESIATEKGFSYAGVAETGNTPPTTTY